MFLRYRGLPYKSPTFTHLSPETTKTAKFRGVPYLILSNNITDKSQKELKFRGITYIFN